MSTLYNPAVSPAAYRLHHVATPITVMTTPYKDLSLHLQLKQDPIHRALLGWLQLVLEEV